MPPEAGPRRGQFRDYRRDRDNRLAQHDVPAAHHGSPAAEPAVSLRPPPERGRADQTGYPPFRANPPGYGEPSAQAGFAAASPLRADRANPVPFAPPRSEPVPAVPVPVPVVEPVVEPDEDSVPTNPLPVILPGATTLHGATALPRPAPVAAPRGFFEAARPAEAPPEPRSFSVPRASSPPVAEAGNAKLEQVKDLYLTAEAIGEDALDKHFEQVSDRQRQLIRDFFNQPRPGRGSAT